MSNWVVRDAKDINTGDLIYFRGHAGVTYLSDGSTVQDRLLALPVGNSYRFNDSYQNPYLEFTHKLDDSTSLWYVSILNNKMWLGKVSSEINIDSSGNVNATAFYQTSDLSKKNIIGDTQLTVKDIANAPSVKFTWKNGNSDTQVGTIAQYWKDVLPEVVRGTEGTYSVDYSVLATVSSISLAKTIIKQNEKIDKLEKDLQELKAILMKLI